MSESVLLPPGWEALYSEDVKRYYFVDHVNKKTQWEDPRLTHPFIWGDHENGLLRKLRNNFSEFSENVIREALLRNQFNLEETKGELASKSATTVPHHASEGSETKNLSVSVATDRSNSDQQRRHSATSRRSGSPTGHSHQVALVDEFAFLAVKSKFSEVSDDIINDVLKSCNNDEEKACKEIMNMGFNRNRQSAMKRIERIELSLEEKLKMKEKKMDEALNQLSLEFPSIDRQQIREIFQQQANEDVTDARHALNKRETARRLASLTLTSATSADRRRSGSKIVGGESGGGGSSEYNVFVEQTDHYYDDDDQSATIGDQSRHDVSEYTTTTTNNNSHSNVEHKKGHKFHSATRKTEKLLAPGSSSSAAVRRTSSAVTAAGPAGIPTVKIMTDQVSALIKPNLKYDDEAIHRVSLALPFQSKTANRVELKTKPELYKSIACGPDSSKRHGPDSRNRGIKSSLARGPDSYIRSGPDPTNLQFASFRKYYIHAA